ncbi:CRP-like cAMP-binding protein [Bosea sp. OAE506]|uniref:cyclic nucleotide-binding domain-containing protein n=1 Tax=Bosea sp. OAE506 TaxID=2663870 RepID=UPI00178A4796
MERLIRALSLRDELSEENLQLLRSLSFTQKSVSRGKTFVEAGSWPQACFLMLSGIACHERKLENGRRQLTGLRLPGDLVAIGAYLSKQIGSNRPVSALSAF